MGQSSLRTPAFARTPLPRRLCNFERLVDTMEARDLDGIVAVSQYNVFYLTSFNPLSHKADEPPPIAVAISRREPEHPIVMVVDFYLAYFLLQPTWVEDIRPFRGIMFPLDIPEGPAAVDKFIPDSGRDTDWVVRARDQYASSLTEACRRALADLGLASGRVGFDSPALAGLVAGPQMEVADASGPLMFVRQVKTPEEVQLMREATQLNQSAIERTVQAWDRGMTWREINHVYHKEAVGLGGFIHDPGAVVFANPRGVDPVLTLQTGFEDFVIKPGMNVMFDCHGTRNLYCWDGGKTWMVEDEPHGLAGRIATASADAMREIETGMRPGVKVSQLQAKARGVFERSGVPAPESAFIFFHGLGLSHVDLESMTNAGGAPLDWALEKGMVVATHLLYPGDDRHRVWLENIALVTDDGGESFFSWDFDPLTSDGR